MRTDGVEGIVGGCHCRNVHQLEIGVGLAEVTNRCCYV